MIRCIFAKPLEAGSNLKFPGKDLALQGGSGSVEGRLHVDLKIATLSSYLPSFVRSKVTKYEVNLEREEHQVQQWVLEVPAAAAIHTAFLIADKSSPQQAAKNAVLNFLSTSFNSEQASHIESASQMLSSQSVSVHCASSKFSISAMSFLDLLKKIDVSDNNVVEALRTATSICRVVLGKSKPLLSQWPTLAKQIVQQTPQDVTWLLSSRPTLLTKDVYGGVKASQWLELHPLLGLSVLFTLANRDGLETLAERVRAPEVQAIYSKEDKEIFASALAVAKKLATLKRSNTMPADSICLWSPESTAIMSVLVQPQRSPLKADCYNIQWIGEIQQVARAARNALQVLKSAPEDSSSRWVENYLSLSKLSLRKIALTLNPADSITALEGLMSAEELCELIVAERAKQHTTLDALCASFGDDMGRRELAHAVVQGLKTLSLSRNAQQTFVSALCGPDPRVSAHSEGEPSAHSQQQKGMAFLRQGNPQLVLEAAKRWLSHSQAERTASEIAWEACTEEASRLVALYVAGCWMRFANARDYFASSSLLSHDHNAGA
eukprot:3667995-Rhodomonas_salina.1